MAAAWGGLFIIFILNYVLFSIKTYLCGYLSLISRLGWEKEKEGQRTTVCILLQGSSGQGYIFLTYWYIHRVSRIF